MRRSRNNLFGLTKFSDIFPMLTKIIFLFLATSIGACFNYLRGQDNNYDQLNYHYYIPFAYLNNRLDVDVAPAQLMHSYLSPYVYLPFYYLATNGPPVIVGIVLGAAHGINFWLAYILAGYVIPAYPAARSLALRLAVTAIALASPMLLSEIGTSMCDALTSILILVALIFLARESSHTLPIRRLSPFQVVAGMLCGAATSLKLTNAVFAIGLGFAAMVGYQTLKERLVAVASAGAGMAAGFLLVGGDWYFRLWWAFHNPFFPFFNNIFRSADFQTDHSIADERFLPHDLFDAVTYPIDWASIQHTTCEFVFRDIRFALIAALVIVSAVSSLSLRLWRPVVPAVSTPSSIVRWRLTVFLVVSLVMWMKLWSIQRYIIPLEVVSGLLTAALLPVGVPALARRFWLLFSSLSLIAIASWRALVFPDWGHLPWGPAWYVVNVPISSQPAVAGRHPLYFLDGPVLSYTVPFLTKSALAIEVVESEDMPSMGDTHFLRRIHAELDNPLNDLFFSISVGPPSQNLLRVMKGYGLVLDSSCDITPGRPQTLTWCRFLKQS